MNSINDYVLKKLEIGIPKVVRKISFAVNYEALDKGRYDVFYYQPKYRGMVEYLKKGKYELKELKEIVRFSKEVIDPTKEPEKIFKYIEIAGVDSKFGKIKSFKKILGKNAPSRARKVLRTGDIVVSTLRETLRSIAIVPKELANSVGTTGFAVLRPKTISKEFLYSVLRTNFILELMKQKATGAIMPAVTEGDLKHIKIPVPPIKIQNEIAEEIQRREQRAEQLKQEAEEIEHRAKQKVEKIILRG